MFNEADFDMFLFLDMETVPEYKSFDELETFNPKKAEIWKEKQHQMIIDKYPDLVGSGYEKTYWERAALYAEYNKIVAITLGAAGLKTSPQTNTFYGNDEKSIIDRAITTINTLINPITRPNTRIWGYYSNRFDIPVLYKKTLMHQLSLPMCFSFHMLKPWDTQCKDVYDLWNVMMGERIGSLDLLSAIFGIESPKEEMDGSMVKYAFYNDGDTKKIANYCNRDVITTINLLRKMSGLEEISSSKFNVNMIDLSINTI